ncbi:family 43 glycosylhydrolase, partial [[Kitasatospora] papulosa]|uniref:beta-xylosidase family glycoside hydrolase n=1 Tax=[Kitasatospora] papulosa TaxID=1464011 RepID=UPI0036CBFF58
SRSAIINRNTGPRFRPVGRELLDAGTTLAHADTIPGWFTLEGPKLYRHDGWFWIFAPAGGVETGWQGAFRSRTFEGPYEERVVLAQGSTDVNGPHQGGWVRTAAGEDWFLHFQARGAYGRVVHLQPMRWEEGWPVIGDEGEPVLRHRLPEAPERTAGAPASDDDFPGGRHGRQWQWTANPRTGWTIGHAGDGLRLSCVRTAYAHDLRALPNVLVQRLPAEEFTVEVGITLDTAEPGAKAGLAVLGDAFSWIGLEAGADGGALLVHRYAETVAEHERDAEHPRPAPGASVRVRIEVTRGARCRFWADTGDGTGFRASGQVFAATPWRWVGALLGLFATAPVGDGPSGTAGFTAFRTTGRPRTV